MKPYTGILIFLILIFTGICPASDKTSAVSGEPSITSDEAKLLTRVSELATTDPKKAIQLLKPEIKEASSAALDFSLASLYFQAGKTRLAETWYRKTLKKFPGFQRARLHLVRVLVEQDLSEESLVELKPLLKAENLSSANLVLAGYVLLMNNLSVAAETAYRKAVFGDPHNSEAYRGLARSLMLQERFSEIIRIIDTLLAETPLDSQLWFIKANCLMQQDQFKKAVVALESARLLKVASAQSVATLGDLYANLDMPDSAAAAYMEAFSKSGLRVGRMLRCIEAMLMLSEKENAAQLLEKAAGVLLKKDRSAEKEHWEKYHILAAGLALLNEKERDAQTAFRKALDVNPLNSTALNGLGDILADQKEFEKAILYYERAQRVGKNPRDSLIRQARVEVRRKEYKKAIQLLEKAQKIRETRDIQSYIEQLQKIFQ